jgi:hypothetical protein
MNAAAPGIPQTPGGAQDRAERDAVGLEPILGSSLIAVDAAAFCSMFSSDPENSGSARDHAAHGHIANGDRYPGHTERRRGPVRSMVEPPKICAASAGT